MSEPLWSANKWWHLAQKVSHRRDELGLSQQAVADRAKISRNYVSLIERGKAQNISIAVLEQLATALQLTVADLLENAPRQTNTQFPPAPSLNYEQRIQELEAGYEMRGKTIDAMAEDVEAMHAEIEQLRAELERLRESVPVEAIGALLLEAQIGVDAQWSWGDIQSAIDTVRTWLQQQGGQNDDE